MNLRIEGQYDIDMNVIKEYIKNKYQVREEDITVDTRHYQRKNEFSDEYLLDLVIKQKMPITQISKTYNISVSTIYNRLIINGWKPRQSKEQLSETQRTEIKEKYMAGATINDLAAEYKITPTYLRQSVLK